jgi:phosphopentomutase
MKAPIVTWATKRAWGRSPRELESHGHTVRRPLDGKPLLLVDEAVIVGDNLEADPGLNINLTVATDAINFEAASRIGQRVRSTVSVGRVIVFGGPGITTADILAHVEERANGQIGINSPALGVYNERLCIQHLGYGVDPDRQAASIISRRGISVVLLGKMADLIVCRPCSITIAGPTLC